MTSHRLAILTPDPNDPRYTTRVEPPIGGYKSLFDRLDVELVAHPWILGPPQDVDGVLANLAWGYHFRLSDWEALLRSWGDAPTLINSPDVLLWNTRKTYLLELARAGVRIIPTLTPPRMDAEAVSEAFASFETPEIVVKPLVSAGSNETFRLRRDDPLPPSLEGRMVQPFLPTVLGEGELSLFFFAGVFSHGVAKVATNGDFRVQPQFGGRFSTYHPDREALDLAMNVLAEAPRDLVYARIDMLRDLSGRLALIELEAIEPDLYFDHAPDGGDAFGRAVLQRLRLQSAHMRG